MSAAPLAPEDPRHGTQNGYGNLGCRCERCRDAHRLYEQRPAARASKERYNRKRGYRPMAEHLAAVEAQHGTESRYTARGCRCGECRAAAAAARRLRRVFANPAKHGLASSYSNGCRCDACRKAATESNRKWRAAQRAAG